MIILHLFYPQIIINIDVTFQKFVLEKFEVFVGIC